jgi:hypothetical protein
MEADMRSKLLDFELHVKEMELKYNTKIDELAIKSRSMVEQSQVKQSGDIFKKIMEGQKEFFNGQPDNNLYKQVSRGTKAKQLLEDPY